MVILNDFEKCENILWTKEIIALPAALWYIIINCVESNNLAIAGVGFASTTAGESHSRAKINGKKDVGQNKFK